MTTSQNSIIPGWFWDPDPDPYRPPQATPNWVDLAADDDRPQPIQRVSNNYVPARRDLPATPPAADSDDAGFVAVTAGALRAGDALHDVTSARDRATADAIRVAIAAGAMVAATAGAAMLALGAPTWLGVLFVTFGGFVMVALAVLTVASLRHSAPGIARHKIDVTRQMHLDRLQARTELAREQSALWVAMVERAAERDERLERMRLTGGRKL